MTRGTGRGFWSTERPQTIVIAVPRVVASTYVDNMTENNRRSQTWLECAELVKSRLCQLSPSGVLGGPRRLIPADFPEEDFWSGMNSDDPRKRVQSALPIQRLPDLTPARWLAQYS